VPAGLLGQLALTLGALTELIQTKENYSQFKFSQNDVQTILTNLLSGPECHFPKGALALVLARDPEQSVQEDEEGEHEKEEPSQSHSEMRQSPEPRTGPMTDIDFADFVLHSEDAVQSFGLNLLLANLDALHLDPELLHVLLATVFAISRHVPSEHAPSPSKVDDQSPNDLSALAENRVADLDKSRQNSIYHNSRGSDLDKLKKSTIHDLKDRIQILVHDQTFEESASEVAYLKINMDRTGEIESPEPKTPNLSHMGFAQPQSDSK